MSFPREMLRAMRRKKVVWCAKSGLQALCIFCLLRVSNLCERRTKAVFELKSMVGWGEHKEVLDKRGFRVYYVSWVNASDDAVNRTPMVSVR